MKWLILRHTPQKNGACGMRLYYAHVNGPLPWKLFMWLLLSYPSYALQIFYSFVPGMFRCRRKTCKCFAPKHYHHAHGWRKLFGHRGSIFTLVYLSVTVQWRSEHVNKWGSVGYVVWLQGQVFSFDLCSTDGLGRLGGLWPGVQRDPQPGRDGCSGNALSQFLHCQPSVFPVWVQWSDQNTHSWFVWLLIINNHYAK